MGHSYSSYRTQTRPPTDAQTGIQHIQSLRQPRSLPPELLLLILEEAYCNPTTPYTTRRAGLCVAALVCRAWLLPAQQLLWRSIEIKSLTQLNALRAACKSNARGPALAANARIFTIWNPIGDPPEPMPTLQDIARLLKCLPRITELRLDRPYPVFPPFVVFHLELAAVRRPDAPQLTVLRISYARASLVHTLLHALPTLRFVEVRGCRSDNTDSDPVDSVTTPSLPPIPRCKLYELRWGLGSQTHAPHALRSSSETLRILALHSLPSAPALAALSPRLRSLRIFRYHHSLPAALSGCDVLEEFVMQDHVPPAALLAALPQSLEHLALDCDDGHQRGLAAVATWLHNGTHTRLRVLTCFSPDMQDADWPDFVRACHSAHVELRCFQGWHGLYGNEWEALGEVARFPRAVPHHAQRTLMVEL